MKRLLILFVIVINCTLVATAQENVAENDMKRFQDAVASADTLKIRSLQKEYLANIEFYSKGASKDEDAYLFYNLMSGLSHLSIAECKEAIPYYTIAYEGYSKQRSHTSVEEKSLSELTGSLGICHAYSQNLCEAVHYASLSVKHAQKSKMDSQVTLSKFWLAQVYLKIEKYPEAYKTIQQVKTKVDDNVLYQSFPATYASILNEITRIAFEKKQYSKLKGYCNDLREMLKLYPDSATSLQIEDSYIVKFLTLLLQKEESLAEQICLDIIKDQYTAHLKFADKDQLRNWERYRLLRYMSFAECADKSQNSVANTFFVNQILKIDTTKIPFSEWYINALWVAHYKTRYCDLHEESIDLLYSTLLTAIQKNEAISIVDDILDQTLYHVSSALYHIRNFNTKPIGKQYHDGYRPILPANTTKNIITKWRNISKLVVEQFGQTYLDKVLSTHSHDKNILGTSYFSDSDLDLILARYYVYYQQYEEFDKVYSTICQRHNLSTEQQLDLLYLVSELMFRGDKSADAYVFVNHIKNNYSNYEIKKWAEERIKDLDSWVDFQVKKARYYCDQGDIDTAFATYDIALKYILETKGEGKTYISVLNRKADALCAHKGYSEAISAATKALELIKIYQPNDFYEKFTSLVVLYISYFEKNEYVNAIPFIDKAIDLLKYKYKTNDTYDDVEQIVLAYNHLIPAYEKLGDNRNLAKAVDDASQYIIKNRERIDVSGAKRIAESIILDAIEMYAEQYTKETLQDNYEESIALYNKAVELLEYGITGYYHIYYNNNDKPLLYLLKTSYARDISTFYKIIEDYWKFTYNCNIYNFKDKFITQEQVYQKSSESYQRLAGVLYLEGINEGAIYVYDKLLKYLEEYKINDKHRIVEIYLSLANIYQRGVKDYCKSIKCHIKSIEASIDANGPNHNSVFEHFDMSQNMYSVCSSFNNRASDININKDGYCKTYDEDLHLYTLWYDIQNKLAGKYGDDYLKSLHAYNYAANMEYAINNHGSPRPHLIRDDLDWKGKMIYDKVFLSILYNRINEAWEVYQELCRHIGYVEVVPYTLEIAETLAENGYYDHAVYMLESNVYSIPLNAGIDALNSTAEKIFTKIAYIAKDYKKIDTMIGYLSIIENQILPAYMANKEGNLKQSVCWYDSQTIASALSLLMEMYLILDKQKGENYTRMLENIVSNNIVGKNGIPLTKTSISDVYNTLSVTTTYPIEQEHFLLEAIKHSAQWNMVYNINLAYVYNESGQYDKADKLLPKIIDYAQNNYLMDVWKEMVLKCTTLNAIWKKDSSKAKVESKKRLDTIIKMYLQKSQMLTNSSRAALWDYSFGSTLQWFSMVDLLNDRDATVSYDAALFHKNILLTQHAMIDKNIRACNDRELKVAHNEYLVAVRNQTDSIEMLESRMMHLYAKHPEFVDTYKPLSWKDVQARLSKKDVAIEFALTEKNATSPAMFIALLLQHNAQNPIVVPLCNYDDLKNLIDKYTDSKTGYANIYDIPDNSLYQLLWSPLQDYLKGVKNIYFAPYDLLNNINFSAIRFEDTKKRIGDMYSLHRLSSTAKLCESASDDTYKKMVAFGGIDYNNYDSLVNTTQSVHKNSNSDDSYSDVRGLVEEWNTLDKTKPEVQHIQSAMTKSDIAIQVHTDTNASEEQFKKLSGDSVNIIHLATHGYYFKANDAKKMLFFNNPNRKIPMNIDSGARSGLILSGGNIAWKGESPSGREDGVLTAKEILGMDLSSADLVVLSACQTALGDIRNDGIYGMQRNIKMAGAKSMIMSLWQVSDEATEIMMTAFYRNLSHGNSKKQAFNKAVAKVRKAYQKKYQKGKDSQKHRDIGSTARDDSSYYWAAFVMLD